MMITGMQSGDVYMVGSGVGLLFIMFVVRYSRKHKRSQKNQEWSYMINTIWQKSDGYRKMRNMFMLVGASDSEADQLARNATIAFEEKQNKYVDFIVQSKKNSSTPASSSAVGVYYEPQKHREMRIHVKVYVSLAEKV